MFFSLFPLLSQHFLEIFSTVRIGHKQNRTITETIVLFATDGVPLVNFLLDAPDYFVV